MKKFLVRITTTFTKEINLDVDSAAEAKQLIENDGDIIQEIISESIDLDTTVEVE